MSFKLRRGNVEQRSEAGSLVSSSAQQEEGVDLTAQPQPSIREAFLTKKGFRLSVRLSDITEEQVDVIVNCNDEYLTGFSSGLPKAIVDKGGEEIFNKAEARSKRRELRPGEIIITDAGNLPCFKVMHAITCKTKESHDAQEIMVKDVILGCLKKAHSRNLKSIAFPAVCTGNTDGVTIENCATEMLDATDEYMKTSETNKHVVADVRFVHIDDAIFQIFRKELRKRYGDCIITETEPDEHLTDATALQNRERLERQLLAEQQARVEVERLLANEQQARQRLEAQLAVEQESRQETERQSATEQQRVQRQLANEQHARQEAERQVATEREALQRVERQRAGAETQIQRMQERASEQEERCNQLVREARDWVLNREDIFLSDKIIGRGSWGEVIEGKFRGTTVAVKRIHQVILSSRNKRRFEREMDMASRCRHPCLLQFIGATAEDSASPLLVTELMDTSLRALLHHRVLLQPEVFTIALDVARALNYLHLNRPDPIIHRDISSGNVLLTRQNDSWRAKLSDYGTANFIQHCVTLRPGAPMYSAPEAGTFVLQTPKIDVYSFGVLLLEMNIPEQPDATRRNEQVAMVTNQCHKTLISRCIQQEPKDRPSMGEIIDILERAREQPLMPVSETS